MQRLKSAKIGSILLAMVLTLVASAAFQIISFRSALRMEEIGKRDAHVRDVLAALAGLRSAMQDAVIGQSGFLLTGEPQDLQLYERAAGKVPELLSQVRTLTANNPVQADDTRRLQPLIERELQDLRNGLDATKPRDSASDSSTQPDPRLMDAIRRIVDRMTDQEQQVRAACLAQTQAAASAQARSLLAASVYRVFILLAGCTLILRQQARQRQTEQLLRKSESRLRHQSLHDALTGLPNRLLLDQRLQRSIERATEDPNYRLAVLFLDLDRFKLINDSLGHAAGDKLLITVAERLRQCVRGSDIVSRAEDRCLTSEGEGESDGGHTVARLAGDEFTVLLEGLRGSGDAEIVAERILREMSKPVDFGGREIRTAASIGIVYADGARDGLARQLLADADTALYKAKASGRGRYVVFDAEMRQSVMDRLHLAGDLRQAVEQGQFVLHYQPIVSLEDRQVAGFEALVRWQHPERGLLPPEQFLDLAEETGLIAPLGYWILQEACRQLAAWRQQRLARRPLHPQSGLTPRAVGAEPFIVVALSRKQLNEPGLLGQIRHLRERQHDALNEGSLRLTIGESDLMQHHDGINGTLHELRSAGVRVWVGNFGAGITSLGCVRSTALDGLKIDGRIVGSAAGRRDCAAVVHSVLELARNLRLQVVAEGLETPEQVAMLQAMGCDLGQGSYFAPAVTAEEAGTLLGAQSVAVPARSA